MHVLSHFLLIPMFTAFFCALCHLFYASRVSTFGYIFALLLCLTGYFLTDAIYAYPYATQAELSYSMLFNRLLAPTLIPLLLMYYGRISQKRRLPNISLYWLIFPAAFFTSELVFHYMMGEAFDTLMNDIMDYGYPAIVNYVGTKAMVYCVSNVIIFSLFIVFEIIGLIYTFLEFTIKRSFRPSHLWNFFVKGGSIQPVELATWILMPLLLCMPIKSILPRPIIIANPGLSIVLSLIISLLVFLLSYVCIFSSVESVTLQEMMSSFRYNHPFLNVSKTESTNQLDTEYHSLASEIFSPSRSFPEDEDLRARFQHIMLDEQLFLLPGLTLVDISERLHSNKTYVSKLVNQTYNIGFPELINTLRIDYAEQYILSHRSARQDEIAKACGFLSASAFNSTFKKVTGMTPKVWIGNFRR